MAVTAEPRSSAAINPTCVDGAVTTTSSPADNLGNMPRAFGAMKFSMKNAGLTMVYAEKPASRTKASASSLLSQ